MHKCNMSQKYSVCEVAQCNGRNDKPVWIIYKDGVYDVTKFIKDHPGGEDTILEYAGKDATKAFNEIGHSSDAIREMKSYKIGIVKAECTQIVTSQPTNAHKIINGKQPLEDSCCAAKKETKLCFCF